MEPERWQQVKTIFGGALEQPSGEQAHYIDSRCQEDAELKQSVADLLTAHMQSDNFLEPTSEVDLDAISSLAGQGQYRIIKRLGSGGMGVVYLGRG